MSRTESPTRGKGLARLALEVFRERAAVYSDGVKIGELARELGLAGHPIAGNAPLVTLRSALNSSQVYGVWKRLDGGMWVPGDGHSKMDAGISGRPLAEALHAHVRKAYPDGVFHYERAREELEQTGTTVRGTGRTTRSALVAATDLFEHVPGRRGYWRWK